MKQLRLSIIIESVEWTSPTAIRQYSEEYMDDNRNDFIDSATALARFVRSHATELGEYVQYRHTDQPADNFFAVPIYHLHKLGATFDARFVQHVKHFPELSTQDGETVQFNLDNETVTVYL